MADQLPKRAKTQHGNLAALTDRDARMQARDAFEDIGEAYEQAVNEEVHAATAEVMVEGARDGARVGDAATEGAAEIDGAVGRNNQDPKALQNITVEQWSIRIAAKKDEIKEFKFIEVLEPTDAEKAELIKAKLWPIYLKCKRCEAKLMKPSEGNGEGGATAGSKVVRVQGGRCTFAEGKGTYKDISSIRNHIKGSIHASTIGDQTLESLLKKDDVVLPVDTKLANNALVALRIMRKGIALSSFHDMIMMCHDVSSGKDAVDYIRNCEADNCVTFSFAWGVHLMNKQLEKIRASKYVAFLADESTNIRLQKHLIMYIAYIDGGDVRTEYFGLSPLAGCKSIDIMGVVQNWFAQHMIDFHKVVVLTADGASTMSGEVNGLVGLMREKNPWLLYQHCAAHRLQLVCSYLFNKESFYGYVFERVVEIANWFNDGHRNEDYSKWVDNSKGGKKPYDADESCKAKLPRVCRTRWLFAAELLETFCKQHMSRLNYMRGRTDLDVDTLATVKIMFAPYMVEGVWKLADVLAGFKKASLEFQTADYTYLTQYQVIKTLIEDVNRALRGGGKFCADYKMLSRIKPVSPSGLPPYVSVEQSRLYAKAGSDLESADGCRALLYRTTECNGKPIQLGIYHRCIDNELIVQHKYKRDDILDAASNELKTGLDGLMRHYYGSNKPEESISESLQLFNPTFIRTIHSSIELQVDVDLDVANIASTKDREEKKSALYDERMSVYVEKLLNPLHKHFSGHYAAPLFNTQFTHVLIGYKALFRRVSKSDKFDNTNDIVKWYAIEAVAMRLKSLDERFVQSLAQIASLLIGSSADCERGFSISHHLQSKCRSRLDVVVLDHLVRIKTLGAATAPIFGGKAAEEKAMAVDVARTYKKMYNELSTSNRRRVRPVCGIPEGFLTGLRIAAVPGAAGAVLPQPDVAVNNADDVEEEIVSGPLAQNDLEL